MEKLEERKIGDLVATVKQRILDELDTIRLPPRTDPAFLSKFIRAKKYRVEDAVAAIHKYYGNIYENLRLLEGLNLSDFANTYKLDCLNMLKHRVDGTTVIVSNIHKWDTNVSSFRDLVLASAFSLEEVFQDPQCQQSGFCIISDLGGFGFSHLRQMSFREVKFAFKLILETLPVRLSGVHLVNPPTIFSPIYKLAMKFLPKKLQERVFIHGDFESLAKVLPPEILPESMGGTLRDAEAWNTEIVQYLLTNNICYDSYWKGGLSVHKPRRLTRKRPSSDVDGIFHT